MASTLIDSAIFGDIFSAAPMRASPACQVSLQRFGAWRAAIVIVAGAGLATLVGWAATRESPFSFAVLVPATLATVWVCTSLWRISAQSLRWDGQAWHLDAEPGDVTARTDLLFLDDDRGDDAIEDRIGECGTVAAVQFAI